MKQQSFWKKPGLSHGGAAAHGKRKTARPIATRRPMHVVVKSERATRDWSLLRHRKNIEQTIEATAKRFHIRLLRRQVNSNHIHLIIQGRKRHLIQSFLRLFPGAVAMKVTNTANTRPIGRFWQGLAFTRIIEWGRDFFGMHNYIEKNRLESEGIPRDIVDMWLKEELG